MKLSVVSPVYNSPKTLEKLTQQISKYANQCADDFEIILVNDCCPENSWQEICNLAKQNEKIIGLT